MLPKIVSMSGVNLGMKMSRTACQWSLTQFI